MSKYSIDNSTLTDIANAIRSKDGSADSMLVSAMAQKILDIPSGSGGNLTSYETGEFTNLVETSTDVVTCDYELNGAPQIVVIVANTKDAGLNNNKRDNIFIRNTFGASIGMANLWVGCQYKASRDTNNNVYIKNVTNESFDLYPKDGLVPTTYKWLALYVDTPVTIEEQEV